MYPIRKNIRLRGHDYSGGGIYFLTICTYKHTCFLGKIMAQRFEFSATGAIAYTYWNMIPEHFPQVKVGPFVIMPNHIHGIISLGTRNGPILQNAFGKTIPGSVAAVMGQYKSSVTRWCNNNDYDFAWQPRYYDHVIRDESDYTRIRDYIKSNIAAWPQDRFYR